MQNVTKIVLSREHFFAKFRNLSIENIKNFSAKFDRAQLVAPTYPNCFNCGEVKVDHTLQQAGQVLLDSQGLAGQVLLY
jgi:hypothetical protein